MRFCATMRRPASSITALTLPVRFRLVASGLMIEKVRSVMGSKFAFNRRRAADREVAGSIASRPPLAKALEGRFATARALVAKSAVRSAGEGGGRTAA